MLCQESNTTVIGRLRIRSWSSDPQAEQQRLARMLRSATLHPSGLPESAMLVVRRLADPLPSRLRAGPRDLLPDASWQQAVASALEKLAASAARPAYGAVPAETNAVLFYDRAEVLASMALDWMSGTLPMQWWWRELLRGRNAITALLREWIEASQYVPAALDLLAQRQAVLRFVQRLPHQAVTEMLDAVIKTHGVPRPSAEDLRPGPVAAKATERSEPMPLAHRGASHASMIAFSALLSRWVPEAAAPGLAPVHKMLLVQTLMLRRAPALARTATFQAELRRWEPESGRLDDVEIHDIADDQPSLPREASRPRSASPAIPKQAAAEQEQEREPAFNRADDIEPISPELTEGERRMQNQNGTIRRSKPRRPHSERSSEQSIRYGSPASEFPLPQGVADHTIVSEPGLPGAPAAEVEPHVKPSHEPSITFETEYGGVFFLLGLALHLYIYGDFSSPAKPGLELNIWDFLSLVGSKLTGGKVEQDPIWDQLASLAGRPKSVRPGLDFDPPDGWRLPEEWLEPFPEVYDVQPVLSDGRLIAKHPAGFSVLDLPATKTRDAEETLDQAGRLERWVKWMAAYFQARLVRALGRDDAVTLVCGRPATVVLTLTHVDVRFSLEHHPIELRIAGLDRDLGWIPAAGRYVAFHFR